jgi:hypothetical protein
MNPVKNQVLTLIPLQYSTNRNLQENPYSAYGEIKCHLFMSEMSGQLQRHPCPAWVNKSPFGEKTGQLSYMESVSCIDKFKVSFRE